MKKLLILIFIGLGLCSFAQTGKPQWVNYYTSHLIICMAPEGNTIWVGSKTVLQLDIQGNILQNFINDTVISTAPIFSIAVDKQGNKWFGTNFGGFLKFDGINITNFKTYTNQNNLLLNTAWSIAFDAQGNKWFGTDIGVLKFDETNWTTYTTANGLLDNKINSIAIDAQGNKWFGTNKGISKFDGKNWTNYTTANGLVSNGVCTIAIDAQGNKWFGTSGGVSKFDGINWTNYITSNSLKIKNISSIALDAQGNKWFGTYGNGVLKFDDTNWTNYTKINGLSSDTVTSIAIDAHGNKWFGSYRGLSVFNENGIDLSNSQTQNNIIDIEGLPVSLYPIPVTDKLNIQLKDACKPSSISIVNALGQTVYSNAKPEGQSIVVDMNGMAKGLYVVQIVLEGKSYSAVVVKE